MLNQEQKLTTRGQNGFDPQDSEGAREGATTAIVAREVEGPEPQTTNQNLPSQG
jgi:hypothetical protein